MSVVQTSPRRVRSAFPIGALPSRVPVLIAYLVAVLVLAAAERISFAAAQVPLSVHVSTSSGVFDVDGSQLTLVWPVKPTAIFFVVGDPAVREFQIDGTDSANNFSENLAYIESIEATPYYRFQAWIRDSSTYSAWRNIAVDGRRGAAAPALLPDPGSAAAIRLPAEGSTTVTAQVSRLEEPAHIVFACNGAPCADLLIDRNTRRVLARTLQPDGTPTTSAQTYFPLRAGPFVADVTNLLVHVALWSLVLLGVVALLHALLLALLAWVQRLLDPGARSAPIATTADWFMTADRIAARLGLRDAWDLAAATLLAGSFAFTLHVSLVEFAGLPHILDASAYYFQAKIFASGRLSVPVPADLTAFQGPFMVAYQGRWFSQYAPGTSAVLALGTRVHLPWLVEPAMGTVALLGVYRIGRLIYGAPEACLAVLLGVLSPFYTFLAASYLSHTVALCFAVYFLLYLLQFEQTHKLAHAVIAAAALGALLLTRELDALIVGGVASVAVAVISRHKLLSDSRRVVPCVLTAVGLVAGMAGLYLLYDWLQTGYPFVTPRALFSPADRYGFGAGVGFYGQHTLAAGFVNLDQQLTSLLIDLFGWPFYLTLALIPCAFLRRVRSWDILLLAVCAALVLAQVGYFYHGIYLGPRYLYTALAPLLLLTARGVTGLHGFLGGLTTRVMRSAAMRSAAMRSASMAVRYAIGAVLAALIGSNLSFYLPRQLQLATGYTGLPASMPVRLSTVVGFHPANTILVTDNWYIYNYILWPLNDPDLSGSTLRAFATSEADRQALHAQYSTRQMYMLALSPDGTATFTPIAP